MARPGGALIVFVAAAAILASCGTPMRLERPDTDEATTEADTVECMAIARAQHRRLTEQPFLVPYFVQARDNKGRRRSIPVVPWQQFGPPVWYPYAPWLANQQVTLKYDLFDRCLEGKGYQRVPDESGEQAAGSARSGDADGSPDAGDQQKVDPSIRPKAEPVAPGMPEGQAPTASEPAL